MKKRDAIFMHVASGILIGAFAALAITQCSSCQDQDAQTVNNDDTSKNKTEVVVPVVTQTVVVNPIIVKAEPGKPTPVKPAPVKPAPVKPTPVKPTPVKPTPVKPAPVKPAPVKPVSVVTKTVDVPCDTNQDVVVKGGNNVIVAGNNNDITINNNVQPNAVAEPIVIEITRRRIIHEYRCVDKQR